MTSTVEVPIEGTVGHLYLFDETQSKKSYDPKQFHFHAPSEHTFDGKHYDLEMHIVHKTSDGTAASVLAVYFDTKVGGNVTNNFLQGLIYTAGNTTNTSAVLEWAPSAVELQTLLNNLNMTKLLNYEGSLTTPTCSEIVEWNVVVDPQPISTAQLAFFTRRWSGNSTFAKGRGNNRVTQAIGDRLIYYYGGPAASSGNFLKAVLSTFIVAALAIFA